MQKNFHKNPLFIFLFICFTVSTLDSEIVAAENPSFFSTADNFFVLSVDWDEETFHEKWSTYPGYLKFDLLKLAEENRVSNSFYAELLKRVASVELDEFEQSEELTNQQIDEIEQKIRSRFTANNEKLNQVKEKYLEEKDEGNMSFEREAQFLHYAFSYFCPIGTKIEPIADIFGQPSKLSNGHKSYFFGNPTGGYRFEIQFDEDDLVTRISFSIF